MFAVRRVWHSLIDLVDGILSSILYGNQGGSVVTTYGIEAENQRKMRQWAASGEPEISADDSEKTDELGERLRRFRKNSGGPRELG